MAPTLQQAWNYTTELMETSSEANAIITTVVNSKIHDEQLTPTQLQNLRTKYREKIDRCSQLIALITAP